MISEGESASKSFSFLSVPRQAFDGDAGDLALDVEAKQNAGRVAAREDELHQVECLLVAFACLQNFGAERRCPYSLRWCDIAWTASSFNWAP